MVKRVVYYHSFMDISNEEYTDILAAYFDSIAAQEEPYWQSALGSHLLVNDLSPEEVRLIAKAFEAGFKCLIDNIPCSYEPTANEYADSHIAWSQALDHIFKQ